jgi:hypothetical protein
MRFSSLFIVAVPLLSGAFAIAQARGLEPIDDSTSKAVARFVSDPTRSALHRLAREVHPTQFVSAVYGGGRAMRLCALEAMAVSALPAAELPFLLALLETRDRSVSGRAAHALSEISGRFAQPDDAGLEMPMAQRQELAERLTSVVRNVHLDPDIRVVAWQTMSWLLPSAARSPKLVLFGLSDDEVAVRRAGLSMLSLPAGTEETLAVAHRVQEDDDPAMRGQAAAALCENALAHGVSAASPDLIRLLLGALSDEKIPVDARGNSSVRKAFRSSSARGLCRASCQTSGRAAPSPVEDSAI